MTIDVKGLIMTNKDSERDLLTSRSLTRRSIVGAAAGVGALSIARLAAGQATPDASPAASPVAAGPEIISSIEGVPPAYTEYPSPGPSTSAVPGQGGTVQMLTISYSPPPSDKSGNQYWQELERRLGVTWDALITPIANYNERLATIFAGGDIPDITFLLPSATRPMIYDAINQGAFADLTEILGSEQINNYPNLAQIPAYLWDAVRIDGRIWGLPKPVLRNNDPTYYRSDWATAMGVETLDSEQTVFDMLGAFSNNDPDGNGSADTYGLSPFGGAWDGFVINQMFRVPYVWRLNDDGTLTSSIETDEYRQSVEYMAALYGAGAYHPDAANLEVQQSTDLMVAGRTGMASNGSAAIFGPAGFRTRIKETVPTAELTPVILPGVGGGQGISYQTQGFFGFNAISASAAADDARLEELLQILNYLYAPFGSDEERFLAFGLEGVHHTVENDAPASTELLATERSALVYPYLSENRFYYAGQPEEALVAQKHNEAMAAVAVSNPTAGLFSPTSGEQGSVLNQFLADSLTALVTGRQGIDTLPDVIAEWQSRGGDQIRTELQDAIAARDSQ